MTIKKYFYNCFYCQKRLCATEFNFKIKYQEYGVGLCMWCDKVMHLIPYAVQSIEHPVDAIAIPHTTQISAESKVVICEWLAAIGELGVEQVDHDEFARRYAEVDGHCIEIDIE